MIDGGTDEITQESGGGLRSVTQECLSGDHRMRWWPGDDITVNHNSLIEHELSDNEGGGEQGIIGARHPLLRFVWVDSSDAGPSHAAESGPS